MPAEECPSLRNTILSAELMPSTYSTTSTSPSIAATMMTRFDSIVSITGHQTSLYETKEEELDESSRTSSSEPPSFNTDILEHIIPAPIQEVPMTIILGALPKPSKLGIWSKVKKAWNKACAKWAKTKRFRSRV